MRIDFTFENLDKDERKLVRDFCIMIRDQIRLEIIENSIPLKFIVREVDLKNAEWINWKHRPIRINMTKLVKLIVKNINITRDFRNIYTIQINPIAKMPDSYNSLDQIARYLDRGDEDIPPTAFISNVFDKYRNIISQYWKIYISMNLFRTNSDSSIKIQ